MAEDHALASQSVEIRSLAEIRPRKTSLLPAEVIGKDEDDIGFRRGVGKSAKERKQREESEVAFQRVYLV
jgi:hypothetical protein